MAAIKLAAQSGISQIQGKQGPVDQIQDKSRAFALVINGFRTNPKDAEGHLLFFDVEALVIQVHIYIVKFEFRIYIYIYKYLFFIYTFFCSY